MPERFHSELKAFRIRAEPFGSDFYPDDGNADLSCDRSGNLWVRQAIGPSSGTGSGAGFTYQAVPGDNEAVIQAVPAILTQVGGFNDSGGNIYVQIHNRIVVPVLGNAPTMTFLVPPNASFAWEPSRGGRQFTTGISFGVSSTRDTYTQLVTNIFLFAEGYIA